MTKRVYAFMIKELFMIFCDTKSRLALILPPLLQLFLFAYILTLDVTNVSLAIYDQDQGEHSYEVIRRISGSAVFSKLTFVKSLGELRSLVEEQRVLAALHISQNFSRGVEGGEPVSLQVIYDGRKLNAAQVVNGYLGEIVGGYESQLIAAQGQNRRAVSVLIRNWFNENLQPTKFAVPSLIALFIGNLVFVLTSLTIAREREFGTMEQCLVAPLKSYEILLGKAIPSLVVGLTEGGLLFITALLVFGIALKGSLSFLILSVFVFTVSVVGLGLTISAISRNQKWSLLYLFLILVPLMTLSGFATPIENMPNWVQILIQANPYTHFLIIVRSLFLQDPPFAVVWQHLWPLFIISSFCLALAYWIFNNYAKKGI